MPGVVTGRNRLSGFPRRGWISGLGYARDDYCRQQPPRNPPHQQVYVQQHSSICVNSQFTELLSLADTPCLAMLATWSLDNAAKLSISGTLPSNCTPPPAVCPVELSATCLTGHLRDLMGLRWSPAFRQIRLRVLPESGKSLRSRLKQGQEDEHAHVNQFAPTLIDLTAGRCKPFGNPHPASSTRDPISAER